MGSPYHLQVVRRCRDQFEGPFLEVGSHDYGSTASLRSLFNGQKYVGIDMIDGAGVDMVLDLTQSFEAIDEALGGERFGTVFCLSVLEHCAQPFAMAQNIAALLRPRGVAYISVPFAWQFHGYPSDYWRFTHEGVKVLFPDLEFEPREEDADKRWPSVAWAEDRKSRAIEHPQNEDIGLTRVSGKWHRARGRWLRGVSADLLRLLGTLGPARWLTRFPYLLRPTMIDMFGRKPAE